MTRNYLKLLFKELYDSIPLTKKNEDSIRYLPKDQRCTWIKFASYQLDGLKIRAF